MILRSQVRPTNSTCHD